MNVLFLEVNVKPEMREGFLEIALDNARHSAEDEPGCLRFDVLQDANNPNLFYYYEVYTNDEAQAAHNKTTHHDRYVEQIAAYLDEKGRVGHRAVSIYSADPAWTNSPP